MRLMDYIPTGAENAIPAKTLASTAGYSSVRMMQQDIHRLREKGNLILSSTEPPNGYYLPASRQEAARFVRSMNSRIREIRKAVQAAERFTADLPDDL